ncbi:hypothetical protein N0V88_002151 [Collariella sp. IMI 366227]|nr:hypothetical protein N0V88_002151 [Collariella sp. IMI 366227]
MLGLTVTHTVSRDIFPTPHNDEILTRGLYEDLDPSRQEIRLIRLRLEDQGALVKCDLLPPISLSQVKGQYSAISYCAGSPTNTRPILVNGVPFNVFANLAHALDITRDFWAKNFPDQPTSCLLWADQICINQTNLAERSHQVGFMRSIYSLAAQTLVCLSTSLSPHSNETHNTHGIEWLVQLHATIPPGDDYYAYYYSLEHHLRTQLISHPDSTPTTKEEQTRRQTFATGWSTLYSTIFHSPWWLRTWVYQEFISSPNSGIHFLYGRASIPWSHISEILPTLRKYRDLAPPLSTHTRSTSLESELQQVQAAEVAGAVDFFVASKMRFDRAGAFDLLELLAQTRGLRSADPRDRVYAFLGLVREDYGIVPDYSKGNGSLAEFEFNSPGPYVAPEG